MTAVAQPAIPVPRVGTRRAVSAAGWLTLPIGLWLLDWSSINSGPWNFAEISHGLASSVNAVRAAAPLAVFTLGIFALQGGRPRKRSWAEIGMWTYGAALLLGATGSEHWFDQAYWAFAFLGALAATELALRSADRMQAIERLNWLSWAITAVALVAMLIAARDVLMAPGAQDSAYNLVIRFQKAHGYVISRASGLSRMAAILAIISLVMLFSGRDWIKLISGPTFIASAYIIWIMQSRGGLFSFTGALIFVLLFGHGRGRGAATRLAFVAGAIALLLFASRAQLQDLWLHATRDEGASGFATMSGRDYIWAQIIGEWLKSPLFGFGPQADRLLGFNAQNALLYALICGGLIGAVCFAAATISAWCALIRLLPLAASLPDRFRLMFQICGALVVFSSLRSIPENNAAVFSVDLLLQYPAMMYLITLANRRKSVRASLQESVVAFTAPELEAAPSERRKI